MLATNPVLKSVELNSPIQRVPTYTVTDSITGGMVTIRQEGNWRLEKQREGVYEVLYCDEPQLRLITPDASETSLQPDQEETLPVRGVSSMSEAKRIFETRITGPPPTRWERSTTQTISDPVLPIEITNGEGVSPQRFSLRMVGGAMTIIGSLIMILFRGNGNLMGFQFGVLFVLVGFLLFSYGIYRVRFGSSGKKA